MPTRYRALFVVCPHTLTVWRKVIKLQNCRVKKLQSIMDLPALNARCQSFLAVEHFRARQASQTLLINRLLQLHQLYKHDTASSISLPNRRISKDQDPRSKLIVVSPPTPHPPPIRSWSININKYFPVLWGPRTCHRACLEPVDMMSRYYGVSISI